MLQQRSKLLLLCLVAVILFLRVYDLTEQLLLDPIRQKEFQIADLETEMIAQKRLSKRIREAEENYEQWLSESLPSRQAEAATLYQNWLVDACESSGFSEVQVTPSSVETGGLGTKVLNFNVSAATDYEGLQYFLRTLEGTALLHQVSELSIRQAKTEYDDELYVQLGIRCMILENAAQQSPSLEEESLAEVDEAVRERMKTQPMSRQSPFLIVEDTGSDSDVVEQPTVMVAKEPIPEVVPAKPDYSGQIVQVGTVMNSSVREVWVMDQRTNEKTIIKEGGDFEFYGTRGVVQSINARYVVIEIKGKSYQWMMAKSLKDRQAIPRRKRSMKST